MARFILKTLMTNVVLPDESTFSAETNMTNNTITGGMSIPEFSYYIYAFGMLPLQVTLKIVPAGPMTGTASLDNNGILHINGHVFADIYLKKAGELGVGIPFSLKTKTPVDFPIVFDGPVSSLGDGSLQFKAPDVAGHGGKRDYYQCLVFKSDVRSGSGIHFHRDSAGTEKMVIFI